jgi:SWIM/SEC-C metal-binding protein
LGGEKMEKVFDGIKKTKLGTEKRPAAVTVQTEERLKEVASILEEKGWKYTIRLEPDKPEDITDLEILLNPQEPKLAEEKVGRNEPCPCGRLLDGLCLRRNTLAQACEAPSLDSDYRCWRWTYVGIDSPHPDYH